MSDTVLVALIGLAGSGLGAFAGVVASAKLTNFRLQQLEDKVNKHNQVVERTFKLEERTELQEAEINRHKERLKALEMERRN